MLHEVILIVFLIHLIYTKSMSLFNLIFVGTKRFGVFSLEKNNFYTIIDFFLEVEHVKNTFEL
jgi:hypothetical protein